MKHFIGITENGIGTINKDAPPEIAGFFTTDQQTCWVLYAVGRRKEKGRLSFAHVNGDADDSLIREVFDWATEKNSDRYFLITQPMNPEMLAIANRSLNILTNEFTPETTNFLKSRRFRFKSYHNGVKGGFFEANFSIDRYGNIKEIDPYELPMNPLQHPLSYTYRMLVNSFVKVFKKRYEFKLDLQFDGDHVSPLEPYPKEWTDAINDSCDIEGGIFYFNKEKFDRIRAHHPDWFFGKEESTFIFYGWFNEMSLRYKMCKDPSDAYDPLFERLPKFEYAIKHNLQLSMF